MAAMGPEGARDWCPVDVGAATVGVAERDALGTTARVVVWPPTSVITTEPKCEPSWKPDR